MYAKKGIGVKKPIDIECVVSAIYPIKGGNTAPPTMAIIIYEDAFLVFGPKSLIASANMVGNMIDMKKKTP